MADDIDIEEHNILESPIIKQMFPDLSILKKEINYNDDIQEISDSEINISINQHSDKNNLIKDKSLQNSSIFNNKFILGTKPVIRKENTEMVTNRKIKVRLHNIKPQLIRSQRFCQRCLILFSEKETLYKHQNRYHNGIGHTEHINNDTKKLNKFNNNNDKLVHIDTNKHFVNERLNKKNTTSKVNVMVKFNESDKEIMDTVACTTLKPCFHCQVLFPSQQSLIDHLYEVLYKKQLQQSPELTKNRSERDTVKEHNEFRSTDDTKGNKKLYRCPICSYYFDVEKFYTGHLVNKHKYNKNTQEEPVKFSSKCKFCNLNYNDVMSYNTHLRKRHRNEIIKKYVHEVDLSYKDREEYTLITKKRHENPSKEKDDSLIKKSMSELSVIALKAILFKCSKCNIHFLTSDAATNHFEHSKLLEQWKCTYCSKIFKQKDANLHENQHNYSKYISVVEVNNSHHPNILQKLPTCAVQLEKSAFIDHHSICEIQRPKSSDCSSKILMEQDALSNKNANELNNQSGSDLQITDADNSDLNTAKKRNDDFQTRVSLSSDSDNLLEDYKHYYFCKICKCSIQKGSYDIHLQPSCNNLKKYICESCGLLFSDKNITTHRTLHKNYNSLILQDFKFYDLNNKKKVRPMDDFPKCEFCEKRFIHNNEVEIHNCSENNHLTCPKCKNKFSDSAYKLHESFHNYVITNDCEPLTHGNHDNLISCVVDNVEKIENNFNEMSYIYTCKNCDVSMNLYDEAIDHCHSHNNLNRIEVSTMKCMKCNLNFISLSYMQHHRLHRLYKKEQFKCFEFDMLYFGCNNDQWLDHVFGSLPRDMVSKIIENSLYKFENRMKMNILQNGPIQLTLHKCVKCQCFFSDNDLIYAHINKCNINSVKFLCTICKIPFLNKLSLSQHKQNHHDYHARLKSFRIISFNQESNQKINESIARIVKYYVLYQCRHCHVVVDKNKYENHECNASDRKICSKCGLLFQERDYEMHVLKHKRVNSFNKNVMKVVLIGNNILDNSIIRINNVISTFSGMVYDYKLYKCLNCEVCVRDCKSISDHYCLINAAKLKCPQCDLIFDEGKLKGHLKLHDTDPDFTKETIMIETFGCNKKSKFVEATKMKNTGNKKIHYDKDTKVFDAGIGDYPLNEFNVYQKLEIQETAKIYKCRCNLHFVDEIEIKEHLKKCSGITRIKQSKQDCFKCGLTFTQAVLFKHILKHHGDKNNDFKYEIIENCN